MSPQRAPQREVDDERDRFQIYTPSGDAFELPPEVLDYCADHEITYEWKAYTVMGKVDTQGLANLARNRWTFVPRDRHSGILEGEDDPNFGDRIVRQGLVLMERPSWVTNKVRDHERQAARDLVENQVRGLGLAPEGTMVDDKTGKRSVGIKRDRNLAVPGNADE